MRTAGYLRPGGGYRLAENIAAATSYLATPAATVRLWMNSPGHRANILAPTATPASASPPAAPASVGSGPGGTYTEDFGTLL